MQTIKKQKQFGVDARIRLDEVQEKLSTLAQDENKNIKTIRHIRLLNFI